MDLWVTIMRALFFWIPAVICLILAIIFFKRKKIRNIAFVLTIIFFLMPSLIRKWEVAMAEYEIEGTYTGKDSLGHPVKIEISGNNTFSIAVENCGGGLIYGDWHYVKEFEEIMFYPDSLNIFIEENNEGELVLNSNIKTDCGKLDQLILEED